jgi:uncharacterized protein YdhG (YjbR/CyaY superfamily)
MHTQIEAYINSFPTFTKEILLKIHHLIKQNVPHSEEDFSYGMPAYKTNGKPLVYFAAYKNHIGFYATPSGHEAFKEKLSAYKQGKGSVQFPLNQVIPYSLIEEIIKYRVEENLTKNKRQSNAKSSNNN